jgi:hypothetical protein
MERDTLDQVRTDIRNSPLVGPHWVRIRLTALLGFAAGVAALYAEGRPVAGLPPLLYWLSGALGLYSLLHLQDRRLYVEKPPMPH